MYNFSHFRTTITLILLIFLVCFLLPGRTALATPVTSASITLSPTSGPPTTTVKVKGTSFKAGETVIIKFDTMKVGKATANSKGAFTAKFNIPGNALPGNHAVQAIGKKSGFSAQAPFLVQTDWSMFGFGPTHTHYNSYENVINTSNVSSLAVDWSSSETGPYYSSAAVVNGIAYVGSINGKVYAFDAQTGLEKWSYQTQSDIFDSPTVANGIVYISSNDGNLYALNADTGTLICSFSVGTSVPPTVVNGVVYVGSLDGHVYALNATNCTGIWSYLTGASVVTSPAVANGVIYIGSEDQYMYALNATNGQKLWSYPTSGAIYSSAAVVNGIVYFGSIDNNVYALNAITGVLKWKYTANNSIYTSSPAVAYGLVYIGATSGNLYALNAMSGVLTWTYNLGNGIEDSPTIANGVLYLNSDGSMLFAFNAKIGTLLWSYSTGSGTYVTASTSVVNGLIYIGAGNNNGPGSNFYAFKVPGTDS